MYCLLRQNKAGLCAGSDALHGMQACMHACTGASAPEAGRLGAEQQQRQRQQQVELRLHCQGPADVEAAAGPLLVVDERKVEPPAAPADLHVKAGVGVQEGAPACMARACLHTLMGSLSSAR
jgi:hypothetical protein